MSNKRLNNQRFPIVSVLIMAALATALVTLVFVSVRSYVSMPEVYKSWGTKECVKVVDHAAKWDQRAPYTCATLPDRYETVWVR